MNFRKKVFFRTLILLGVLIFSVCFTLAFFSFWTSHEETLRSEKLLVNFVAASSESLILLDDRVALTDLLNSLVKDKYLIEYAFFEKNGSPYVSTFTEGTPASLLTLHQSLTSTPGVQQFATQAGTRYVDIARKCLTEDIVLHIGLSRDKIHERAFKEIWFIVFFGFVVFLVGAFSAGKISLLITKEVDLMHDELAEKQRVNEVFLNSLPTPATLIKGVAKN